jgi:hypothetical protein
LEDEQSKQIALVRSIPVPPPPNIIRVRNRRSWLLCCLHPATDKRNKVDRKATSSAQPKQLSQSKSNAIELTVQSVCEFLIDCDFDRSDRRTRANTQINPHQIVLVRGDLNSLVSVFISRLVCPLSKGHQSHTSTLTLGITTRHNTPQFCSKCALDPLSSPRNLLVSRSLCKVKSLLSLLPTASLSTSVIFCITSFCRNSAMNKLQQTKILKK